eukprot:SAG31_NODE_1343_length_8700_cov_1.967911_7_plen_71_part_00
MPSLRGKIEIVLAGAVRHASDQVQSLALDVSPHFILMFLPRVSWTQGRLDRLKELANELGIADSVRFEVT